MLLLQVQPAQTVGANAQIYHQQGVAIDNRLPDTAAIVYRTHDPSKTNPIFAPRHAFGSFASNTKIRLPAHRVLAKEHILCHTVNS